MSYWNKTKKYVKTGIKNAVKNPQALMVALKCAREIWRIKGMINCEQKTFATSGVGSSTNWTGVTNHITSIAEGDGSGNREGISILGRRILIKGQIGANASSAGSEVRVLLVRDRFCTGTLPTLADVIPTGNINAVNSAPYSTTKPRYQILFDRRYTVSPDGKDTKPFYIDKRFRTHVRYTGSSGVDEYNNQFFLMYVSNEETYAPTVNYYTQFFYYDN